MPLKPPPNVRVTNDKFIEVGSTYPGGEDQMTFRLREGVREGRVDIDLGMGNSRELDLDELILSLQLIKEGI